MLLIDALNTLLVSAKGVDNVLVAAGPAGLVMRPAGKITEGYSDGTMRSAYNFVIMRAKEPGARRFAWGSLVTRGEVWTASQPDSESGDINVGYFTVRRTV